MNEAGTEQLALFTKLVQTLWPNNEPAIVSLQPGKAIAGTFLTDLRWWYQYPQQYPLSALPQHWVLGKPIWYERADDSVKAQLLHNTNAWASRDDIKKFSLQGVYSREKIHYHTNHPFLVLEVDRLVYDDADPGQPGYIDLASRGIDKEELKQLQKDAFVWALQASGFPYHALIDSGSKSIHVIVRLNNTPHELLELRGDQKHFNKTTAWLHLEEALQLCFGALDIAVLRAAGSYGVARTPAATRENGNQQTIVDVRDDPVSIQDILQWCYDQLSPTTVQHMRQHRPVGGQGAGWKEHPYRLNLTKPWNWRDLILNRMVRGGGDTGFGGFDDWMMRVNRELAQAGQRQPEMLERPCPVYPVGQWNASFLFYVQAYVINHLCNGWFFSHEVSEDMDRSFGSGRRVKWPDEYTLEQKVEENVFTNAREALVDMWVEQAEAYQQRAAAGTADKVRFKVQEVPGTGIEPDQKTIGIRMLTPRGRGQGGGNGDDPFDPELYVEAVKQMFPGDFRVVTEGEDSKLRYYFFTGKIWELFHSAHIEAWVHGVYKQMEGIGPQSRHVNEIIRAIHRSHPEKILAANDWTENPDAIVFSNGTLYIDEANIEIVFHPDAFRSEDMMLRKLDYPYDPYAKCPLYEKALTYSLPDPETRQLYLEFVAGGFVSQRVTKHFLMLIGPGDRGKSTQMSIIRKVMGEENVASCRLSKLNGEFSMEPLIHKRVIMDDDANIDANSDWHTIANAIKGITGGSAQQINRKNKSHLSLPINGQLTISANSAPRFKDQSDALWNRALLIYFDVKIVKEAMVVNLEERVNLSGVANLLIKHLLNFLKRNRGFGIGTSYLVPAKMKEAVDELRKAEDPVYGFVKNYMRKDKSVRFLHLQYVYECYVWQCARDKVGALGKFQFMRCFCQYFDDYVFQPPVELVSKAEITGWPDDEVLPEKIHNHLLTGFACVHPEFAKLLERGPAPMLPGQGPSASRPIPLDERGTATDNSPLPWPRRDS